MFSVHLINSQVRKRMVKLLGVDPYLLAQETPCDRYVCVAVIKETTSYMC